MEDLLLFIFLEKSQRPDPCYAEIVGRCAVETTY
jgi:hypothetical protein